MTTLRNAFDDVRTRLRGIENAEAEAYWLFQAVTGLRREALLLQPHAPLADTAAARLRELAERRATGEPLQYLLGGTEFMGRDFLCDSRALIPRPDTECLVLAALELIPTDETPHVAELGVGAGIVTITLALERPEASFVATDLSADALALARENAARWGVCERIDFRQGDLLEPLAAPVDLLLFNAPYVPSRSIDKGQVELNHEPRLALDGGEDGLDVYRRLAGPWRRALNPGGWLLVEVGARQSDEVARILSGSRRRYWRDQGGVARVVGVSA